MRVPPPDFETAPLRAAPDARFAPAPADGVLPEGFYSTTNLPTWLKADGRWRMPREPRMDACLVRALDGTVWAREMRRVRLGDPVAVGLQENGSEGILVKEGLFDLATEGGFKFMTSDVSREKPTDYDQIARLIVAEKSRGGHVLWVAGPALVHARAREDLAWFVANGYVGALLAGNAVAVHDIEASLFGTTLGIGRAGEAVPLGHGAHLRAINRIRAAGGIAPAVHQGILRDGVMHACVVNQTPFVLCGSIRDDGPLPEVVPDVLDAQDAMRLHATRATAAVFIATALHAIAVGNMLPSFVVEPDGWLRPLPVVCVDASEFVVSKLRDRGTHQAFGVVTNAQDFLRLLRLAVQELPQERPS
jgi:lysine-ketoglutarate reductase/saccharopine dehydrogenase-like protein (TIGR00300 family)